MAYVGQTGVGREAIGYWKTFPDGSLYYVEEVRTGAKTLSATTLRKQKPEEIKPGRPNAQEDPQSHVRNALPGSDGGGPTGASVDQGPRQLYARSEPAPAASKDSIAPNAPAGKGGPERPNGPQAPQSHGRDALPGPTDSVAHDVPEIDVPVAERIEGGQAVADTVRLSDELAAADDQLSFLDVMKKGCPS